MSVVNCNVKESSRVSQRKGEGGGIARKKYSLGGGKRKWRWGELPIPSLLNPDEVERREVSYPSVLTGHIVVEN